MKTLVEKYKGNRWHVIDTFNLDHQVVQATILMSQQIRNHPGVPLRVSTIQAEYDGSSLSALKILDSLKTI